MFTTKTRSRTVPASKVKQLGAVGGLSYFTHDGAEFYLGSEVADIAELRHDGELVISFPVIARDDRGATMTVGNRLHRAMPVPPGTHERLSAKATAPRATVQVRLVDALDLPELASRGDRAIPMPAPAAFGGFFPAVKAAPSGLVAGREQVRGRAILDWLSASGVELQAHEGKLLVRAPRGRLLTGPRAVIERAERLLIGWLTDSPVVCELDHNGKAPEAITIALGGVAVCAEHLAGEASS